MSNNITKHIFFSIAVKVQGLCNKKRSSRGRYLRRRARTSILPLYQTRAEISIICPCFVIMIRLLICLLILTWFIRKRRVLSSLTFFILEVSIMILQDCFTAFLRICSSEFALADFGDFISNSIPSNRISAVFVFIRLV